MGSEQGQEGHEEESEDQVRAGCKVGIAKNLMGASILHVDGIYHSGMTHTMSMPIGADLPSEQTVERAREMALLHLVACPTCKDAGVTPEDVRLAEERQ